MSTWPAGQVDLDPADSYKCVAVGDARGEAISIKMQLP